VTALCPGPVDTGFFDDGGFEESEVTDGPLADPRASPGLATRDCRKESELSSRRRK
jgi:short-subunit dehydrogenase